MAREALKAAPTVVRTTRVHPFRLWLLQTGRTAREGAKLLGISTTWLSQVLRGRRPATRELYRDMAKISKGAVTLRELLAYSPPSERPRRRDVARVIRLPESFVEQNRRH